ncbi:MAG: hypothetical protein NE328_02400 [Lentisphaeraceae bacterium]|nr:hypothetical protein [Lentisphaeraceae bacterium]
MKLAFILFIQVLFTLISFGESLDNDPGLNKPEWNKPFTPKRLKPIFEGAFSVRMILIDFPDTDMPDLKDFKKKSLNFGPMSATDYFKEYSQGITWPEFIIAGEEDFPKNVFRAPNPIGYYCEYDFWNNPLGYKDRADGGKRANDLKTAANKFAAKFKLPNNAPNTRGKAHVNCHVYASKQKPMADWQRQIKPFYKDRKHPFNKDKDICEFYKPKIGWSDPLWPNSSVQVTTVAGGGTLVHELGHVLGAPDFYHAPEKFDGVKGSPCEGCSFGPTGPGYCRYIYNAFVTEKNYPTFSKNGRYTLSARKTNPAGDKILGAFILSTHPHYVYHLEYVSGEKAPLGNPGKKGLLVHAINVTMNAPYLGSPDMCYTYHANDPWFQSEGSYAYFGKANKRMSFSMESEPSSRLPNLMDGGMSFVIVEETNDSVTIELKVPSNQVKGNDYKISLLPKVSMDKIDEVLPSSFRAHMNVQFRGEPLLTEYGFCWDTRSRPQAKDGKYFPLYHRDRYDGRVLGLRPRLKYYVRAYAKNKYGISYSEEELTVVIPEEGTETVAPLLDDTFSGNWTIQQFHQSKTDSSGDGTTVGSMALTTLLKLMNYYREPFSASSGKSKSRSRSRSSSNVNGDVDYTRIHTQPTLNRPDFRLVEFYKTVSLADKISKDTGMTTSKFEKGFDKDFIKSFKLKNPLGSRKGPIEPFTKELLPEFSPRIIQSLLNGEPVVIAQEPKLSSPIQFGLSWVIIDGVNDKGLFHLIYPAGKDRQYKRKSNWYPLETLLEGVSKAKIIWGLKPQ